MKKKFIILSSLVLATVMLCTSCFNSAPAEKDYPVVIPADLAAQSAPSDDGADFDFQVSGTITDHMVLQRNQYINVYGTSEKVGGIVYADFKGETRWAKVDENGKWHIQFNPEEASTDPVELVVYNKAQGADNGVKFTDILIGDVWMIAGQSNAQVALDSTLENNPDFLNTIGEDNNIRLFTQWYWDFMGTYFVDDETAVYQKAIEKKEMDNPPENVKWQIASEKVTDEEGNQKYVAQNFSAVGYYFAKKVSDETGVPIGMIQAPAGGAALHSFIPMDKDPDAKGVSIFEESDVYNCLMAPFAKTSIAGMLWYQGEANESAYYSYADDLKEFIGYMREIWGENMAFYNVQITSHASPADAQWPNIQEIRYQQAELVGEVDNYYLVSSLDCGSNSLDTDWAHPRNKKPIGDRLAYVALSKYYTQADKASGGILDSVIGIFNKSGYDIEDYGSPVVYKVVISGSTAKLYYKYVGDGLKTSDGSNKVGGFYSQSAGQFLEAEIVGKNCVKVKLLDRAGYSITGSDFRLVYAPTAMADQTVCNLQNSNGIAAAAYAYTHIIE